MGSVEANPVSGLTTLVSELNYASQSFNPASDLDGYKSRVEIIAKAKEIIHSMTDPSDMAFSHCTNVSLATHNSRSSSFSVQLAMTNHLP